MTDLPPLPEPFAALRLRRSPNVDVYRAWADQMQTFARAAQALEREKWQKDAERYRQLRDNSWSQELESAVRLHKNALWDGLIDAAIDAASAATSEEILEAQEARDWYIAFYKPR